MPEIRKLLIANRGEIAARVMRTARHLDISTVAVFSSADAAAPYVGMADEAVHLPGDAPGHTYLCAEAIIAAARRAGADAVHPGYGFLSENAGFARACADHGLLFVGPPPAVIEAMGSKITAKEVMAAAGVPVLPWMTLGGGEAGRGRPGTGLASRAGQALGYPLMVKAAFGGGGRGLRVVAHRRDLPGAMEAASREAAAAFGDGTVFLERFLDSPRHVEVQIFGDSHGGVAHLFERECSVQRRYQKIIEEAPSPAVDPVLRAELGSAAVAAAKAIGYVGAGTIEFVLGPERQFYFLEVNTRLQVEHPVTELVTGLDLVELQLLIAEGRPLPGEVRAAALSGHAIEARLYAEDATAGFLPATGTVHAFRPPALPGVRVDAGVSDGSQVGVHYDALLAKVIAHGATRDQARRRLARALTETRLHGVTSNRDLLVGILRDPEFRAGRADTGFLGRRDPALLSRSWHHPQMVRIHALAAALAGQAARRAGAPVLASVPSGWRNVPNGPQQATFSCDGDLVTVRYQFGRPGVTAEVNGEPIPGLVVRQAAADRVVADVDGVRHEIGVNQVAGTCYTDSALGAATLAELPRFPEPVTQPDPGSLLAPLPGTVVRLAAQPGARVTAGAPVVVLEAMKMEHQVRAPYDGTVATVAVSAGQAVDAGTVLAVVEPAEGGAA